MTKLFLSIIIIILFIQVSFSQENPDNQEFEIHNFRISKSTKLKDKIGLNIHFDLVMKHALKDYFQNPYQIFFQIRDENNEIVFTSEKSIEVKAHKSYNKNIAEKFGLNIFIPYELIDVSVGTHNLVIETFARNSSKEFPVFFKRKINVKKKTFYSAREQSFRIKNYRTQADAKQFKLNGLRIDFSCKLKFDASQISEIYNDEKKGNYTFYIKLIDEKTGDEIDYFKSEIAQFEIIPLNKNFDVNIFIPYNKINLSEGFHNVIANLYVVTNDGFDFGKIASGKIKFKQKKLYIFNFNMKSGSVTYKKYDYSNVFGRIFSRRSSNTGKGYPDVFWKIKLGKLTEYVSHTNRNSFTVPSQNTSFIVADADPVKLFIMDHDDTSADDFIGSKKLNHTIGNYSKEYRAIKFDGISATSFSYKKQEFPKLLNYSINSKITKRNGITGVDIDFNYAYSYLPESSNVVISPLINKNLDVQSLTSYFNIENKANITYSEVLKKGSSASVQIFVPMIQLPENSKIGFQLQSDKYNFLKSKVFDNTEIKQAEIHDIKSHIVKVEESYYNKTRKNIYGVNLYLQWEIPKYYKEHASNIMSEVRIILNSETIMDTAINLSNSNDLQVFMPYYKLFEFSGKQDFKVQVKSNINNVSVEKSNLSFNQEIPKIQKIQISKIKLKNKNFNEGDKIFIQIKHDNNVVYTSELKDISKKVSFENFDTEIYCNEKDKVIISVLTKDKYGISSEFDYKEIKASKFQSKKIKLKGDNQNCKKIYIYKKS